MPMYARRARLELPGVLPRFAVFVVAATSSPPGAVLSFEEKPKMSGIY
jgi:hypothetical protein